MSIDIEFLGVYLARVRGFDSGCGFCGKNNCYVGCITIGGYKSIAVCENCRLMVADKLSRAAMHLSVAAFPPPPSLCDILGGHSWTSFRCLRCDAFDNRLYDF